jgi:hypothetical protein
LRSLAGLTALTDLNVSYCSQVTENGLRALLAGLTALTNLNLEGCWRVSEDGLRTLVGLTASGGWDELTTAHLAVSSLPPQ